jgi:uncharacterized protein (DUF2336 family)
MPAIALAELEEKFRTFDPQKRQETLRALTDLFLVSAPQLDEAGVEIFDNVFDAALEKQSVAVLTDVSRRMAPIPNAPSRLIRRLANDSEIAVAGPVLYESPRLSEEDLCNIARSKGNAHMLAMSTRRHLSSPVTDILIDRGDNEVARTVAANETAALSETGVSRLIERAKGDETIGVGLYARRDLWSDAIKAQLDRAEARSQAANARIAEAQRFVLGLNQTGELTERRLAGFAEDGKYEELIAAISLMSKLKHQTLENMMHGQRLGGLTLVCKSLGFSTITMNAIWKLSMSRNRAAQADVQSARRDFLAVSKEMAERVVRFWLVRQTTQ